MDKLKIFLKEDKYKAARVSVGTALFALSGYLGIWQLAIFILVLAIFLDRDSIYPILIFAPIVEYNLIIMNGMTVTRLVIIAYIGIFIYRLVKGHIKNIFSKKHLWFYIFTGAIILLVIISVSRTLIFGSVFEFKTSVLLSENIALIIKIIMAVMLYIDFAGRDKEQIKTIAYAVGYAFAVSTLLTWVLVYITKGFDIIAEARRFNFFEGADTNTIAGLTTAFLPFIFLLTKKKSAWIVGALSIYAVLDIGGASGSRAGFLTLIFLGILLLFMLFVLKDKKDMLKKIITFTLIFSLVMVIGTFNRTAERVNENQESLHSITNGRSTVWRCKITRTFNERPLFGWGSSKFFEKQLVCGFISHQLTAHNMIINVFVRYGFIGLSLYLSFLIWCAVKFFKSIKKREGTIMEYSFLLCMALLYFTGMSQSWFEMDFIWTITGISMGVLTALKKNSNAGIPGKIII